jgi:hypothetical protein
MASVARSGPKQGVHDRVIGLLAQRWSKRGEFTIATNPGSEKNRWAGSDQNYPDLVAWVRDGSRDKVVWIAEVETEESVTEVEARAQWRDYNRIGTRFYLVVPAGYGATARQLAARVGITLDGVYEYRVVNGGLDVTQ